MFDNLTIYPIMRQILLSALLLGAFAASASAELYISSVPVHDPMKTIPTGENHLGPNGRPNALVIISTTQPGLKFFLHEMEEEDLFPQYIADEEIYSVSIPEGTETFYIQDPANPDIYLPVYYRGGFQSSKVYTLGVTTDRSRAVHATTSLKVETDPGATVFVDGLAWLPDAYGSDAIEVSPGSHVVYASKNYQQGTYHEKDGTSQYADRTYLSDTKKINVSDNGSSSVKVPVTGAIEFRPHEALESATVHVNISVDEKHSTAPDGVPSTQPEESYFETYSNRTMPGLYGNYVVKYSAKGFKSKKSYYSVGRGDVIDGEIKLDPANASLHIAFVCSPQNLLGLTVGSCSKFIGWDLAGGGLSYGENSTLSWYATVGPMFRILRAKTNVFLSIVGGYGQQSYNRINPDYDYGPVTRYDFDENDRYVHSSWMAGGRLVFRFRSGFAFGIGYLQPLKSYDGPNKRDFWNNFSISLGYCWR